MFVTASRAFFETIISECITREGRSSNLFLMLYRRYEFLNKLHPYCQLIVFRLFKLLDYAQLDKSSKIRVLTTLLKLSRQSGLYPDSFKFSSRDVGRAGIYATTTSNSRDIYKSHLKGRDVCFKIIRMYQDSDSRRLYKVPFSYAEFLALPY
jgi:hypothetical protein